MSSSKPKTSTTCDRCRRHKSRCDGAKPACGQCVAVGAAECLYKPTVSKVEIHESLSSKMGDIETRLASLEKVSGVIARVATEERGIPRPPERHTAAGHQMLHSWPRVRDSLTVPGFEPLRFLEDADRTDPFLKDAPDTLRVWQLVRPAVDFYDEMAMMPAPMVYLFEVYEPFGRDEILLDLQKMEQESEVHLRDLSVAQLTVLSMALWTYGGSLGDELGPSGTSRAAFGCLRAALDKQWTLLTATRERVVLGLALAVGLVYLWSRPFHALGLLQSVDLAIKRWSLRKPDESLLLSCCKLYLVLESDILTEIDEYSSDAILSGDGNSAAEVLNATKKKTPAPAVREDQLSVAAHLDTHVWLRGHQNRILHLYTPGKSASTPQELEGIVGKLSSDLDAWYATQPSDQRFPRDATTFYMTGSSMSLHTKEVAVRYFACDFFLYRPVLHSYLHRTIDETTPDPDPWILSSCRDCIESAALIIQLCGSGFANNLKKTARSWCDYQLLFAAFLVILQVKGEEVFEPVLKHVGNAERLLDRVEGTFELGSADALVLQRSLAVLRNMRKVFSEATQTQTQG